MRGVLLECPEEQAGEEVGVRQEAVADDRVGRGAHHRSYERGGRSRIEVEPVGVRGEHLGDGRDEPLPLLQVRGAVMPVGPGSVGGGPVGGGAASGMAVVRMAVVRAVLGVVRAAGVAQRREQAAHPLPADHQDHDHLPEPLGQRQAPVDGQELPDVGRRVEGGTQRRLEQVLLGREDPEQGALGDAAGRSDLPGRHVRAGRDEQRDGRRDDGIATVLGGESGSTGHAPILVSEYSLIKSGWSAARTRRTVEVVCSAPPGRTGQAGAGREVRRGHLRHGLHAGGFAARDRPGLDAVRRALRPHRR
ncbi:hypothetical protein SDC9_77654 [bioreactor metagenome]|uniref:Uncharacterized protein n=1 Tax=bioreactor metagenome TaxID=1076179 RepID=A0A644YT93_9ZZZZ